MAGSPKPKEISKHNIHENKGQVLSPSKGSVRIKIMNLQVSACMQRQAIEQSQT